MHVGTLREGQRLVIGDESRTVRVKEIDPSGKWVKLETIAPEHVTVKKAAVEQPTTR